jgi:FXSXX-COOH protein
MDTAVDDSRDEISELPDLTDVPLDQVLSSDALATAQARIAAEATQTEITAGFGSSL